MPSPQQRRAKFDSAIFTGGADLAAVKGWVQSDFEEFKGTAVSLVRCYSMAQSGDGISGSAKGFHAACDGKGATVTIVKTKKGFVFGGAADKSWASPGSWALDASDSAFLFCVKCAGAGPSQLKLTGKNNQDALGHHSGYGPIFGFNEFGNDLLIDTPSGPSCSSLGYTYTCPAGRFGSAACSNYLAGSRHFAVADYEVFVIRGRATISTTPAITTQPPTTAPATTTATKFESAIFTSGTGQGLGAERL